ncbi:MAG: hypothetical protein JWO33_2516, partial [Caulobacteraceae bacterium]|nr:hypothetical protein [Caulobacteraceae bacterium]
MTAAPVIIVGAGPVGAALALDLAWRGVRSVLIERDPATAHVLLAKAGTLNSRTMEFCRRWGVVDQVATRGFPDDFGRGTYYCTALNGELICCDWAPTTRNMEPPPTSPEILRKCPQYIFDPILVDRLGALGLSEIQYGAQFEGLREDKDGVTAHVRDVATGEARTLRGSYLIGCEGVTSGVRNAIGVASEGKDLGYSVSVMVRADNLDRHHPMGEGERYMFIGPEGTWANLTAVDGRGLWRFTLIGSQERRDLAGVDFAAEIRRAFGRDDVPFEILRVMPWRRSQSVADSFGRGRVFLAGDSAHTTSPTGGHGLNTGLGDAFGLGWMLEARLQGWGGDHLLDAYGIERRPVAIRNSESSTRNFGAWVAATDFSQVFAPGPAGDAARREIGQTMSARLRPEWHCHGVAMGYR